MTQSTKFPNAEAIAEAAGCVQNRDPETSAEEAIYDGIIVALNSYRTRTGIDLADVSEKLAAGTHVLLPKGKLIEMLEAVGEFLNP